MLPPAAASSSSAASSSPVPASFGSTTATLTSAGTALIRVPLVDAASGRPDASLALGVVRQRDVSHTAGSSAGSRFYFDARDIRCVAGANHVVFTVDGSRHVAPCRPGLTLISNAVPAGHIYEVEVRAVRMRRQKIVAGGALHVGTVRINQLHKGWAMMAGGAAPR